MCVCDKVVVCVCDKVVVCVCDKVVVCVCVTKLLRVAKLCLEERCVQELCVCMYMYGL